MLLVMIVLLSTFSLLFSSCGGAEHRPVSPVPSILATQVVIRPSPSPALVTGRPATPTPLPTAPLVPAPVGLVYRTEKGLWRTTADGRPVLLFDQPYAELSPEALRGDCVGYALVLTDTNDAGQLDLWLVDLATGQGRNLTNTAERRECCPRWWPARPDMILFGSWEPDEFAPNMGFLTTVNVDGSGYQLLDSTGPSWTWPAPSPDGRSIAYDKDMTPWIYRWDEGPQPLDLTLAEPFPEKMGSPSWSPDGQRLAWIVDSLAGETWQLSVLIVDLNGRTGQLRHLAEPMGRDEWPPPAQWSPDSRWLAYAPGSDRSDPQDGVWLLTVDSAEERLLGPFGDRSSYEVEPVWSPDGRQVVYSRLPWTTWLVDLDTGELRQVDLPPGAQVIAWVELAP